jgi:acyl-CoA dehydrogenase family member 9
MGTMRREEQIAEAEEMLGDSLNKRGFVKSLFFGNYASETLPQYPTTALHDPATKKMADDLRGFCKSSIDPVAIDREARIPDSVIYGLGQLGVLGACLPKNCGGRGLTQTQYCQILEILGGHCASTALFVNAHHSIGPRAIVLFGTDEQKKNYLPKLASGEWISAFALTEPEAGSDAGNVQTTATPTDDGQGFILNGTKRWITNGGIAQVLTVIARTPTSPIGLRAGSKPTAFLVTPDMPGFKVLEERMPKCGVRGTATARLAFENMYVPRQNILGELGKGLKVALTVLDFGRTTFGASCTGAAKYCLQQAVAHANNRVQFGQRIGEFELVKDKLARMAAGIFAMESCTYQTAALIDAGSDDYMLETAILKVMATDILWTIVNDTIQTYGGKAYFTDEPYERLMRDARINMIGEGANDVLKAFVALVGMRDVGLHLQGILQSLKRPIKNFGRISSFAGKRLESFFRAPEVPIRNQQLLGDAEALSQATALFGSYVEKLLAKYKEGIVDRQYHAGRIADAAIELYSSASMLRRLDTIFDQYPEGSRERTDAYRTGSFALKLSDRKLRRALAELWDNDDDHSNDVANGALGWRKQ